MLGDLFEFKPMEVPDAELKPVERAFLNGIRNLEVAMVRMGTMWMTLLVLLAAIWGIGGYLFYSKLDEFSTNTRQVTELKIELRYLKENVQELKAKKEEG